MIDARHHEPDIAKLIAQRRKALDRDGFITDYDGITDDGDKYEEMTVKGGGGSTVTIKVNLTKMYQAAPSTTGDIQLLQTEAELIDDGVELENPHIPASVELLERAKNTLSKEGLTPAWEIGL